MNKITLAGVDFEIAPLPFIKLRKIMVSLTELGAGDKNPALFMENAAVVFSILTNKTVEEINDMPISIKEMNEAILVVPSICGIEQGKAGEVQAVQTGTLSTAI